MRSNSLVRMTLGALLLLALFAHTASPDEPPTRISQDLLAFYTFERPTDGIIRDRSGVGEPVDLKVEASQGVAFRAGKLIVTSSAKIASPQPARKIVAAIKQSNGLTIEAWVKPQDKSQAGPARIVSLSADPGQRDFCP